jgi:signal transduction histidine kinase
VTVLLVPMVARTLTRPLQRSADAASAFGSAMHSNHVPDETGTIELRRTARAFNDMQARIQRFVEESERLFASISHDLKTPITRLKLRTELLDDAALQADFHADRDELDVRVEGALQSVKDGAIHKNGSDVRLDRLVERLTSPALAAGARTAIAVPAISVRGKLLALERALGSLIDNGLRYGEHIYIAAHADAAGVRLTIRDPGPGPGLSDNPHEEVFEPYVRLAHGREGNRDVRLNNHPQGRLVATVRPLSGLPPGTERDWR